MAPLRSAEPAPARGRRPNLVRIDAWTAVALDDALQFMRELWSAVHALQKASKRMNRELGVTGPQRLVLRLVGLSPGISAGGLARTLHLHPSTVTGVLKRLEEQGLLSRLSDVGDARRAVLRLTSRGQRVNLLSTGTVEAAVRATLATVSSRDRLAAQGVLSRLAERLADRGQTRQKRPARQRR
jgi:MarR family transcriptional regulator, organic hydroperoxide resistance regulator